MTLIQSQDQIKLDSDIVIEVDKALRALCSVRELWCEAQGGSLSYSNDP